MRFLSRVASWGIGLGVAALILSLAALSGLQRVLRAEVLARTPHLEVVLPADADWVGQGEAIADHPRVVRAQTVVEGQGWLVSERGLVQPVAVTGFEGTVPRSFPGAAGEPEGLYVDHLLSRSWDLESGDFLEVVSPRPTLAPFGGPQPRLRAIALAGTFEKPRTQEDRSRIAVPLALAESLFGRASRRIVVETTSLAAAVPLAGELRGLLPAGSEVRTWRDINRPLFFVLRLEKALMFVSVSLVVLVAALSLVSSLSLVVASKQAEIGMLGAMGAPTGTLRRAFLLLGALLAGRGLAAGAASGIAAAWLLDRFRLLKMPGDVFVFDYIPFLVRFSDVAAVVALTLILALAFSSLAASRAAAVTPVRALAK